MLKCILIIGVVFCAPCAMAFWGGFEGLLFQATTTTAAATTTTTTAPVTTTTTTAATDYTADASCMAAYFMNSASGANETDRSGEGNTLVDSSSVVKTNFVPSGFSGSSKLFDGSERLEDTTPSITHGDELTVACWVYFTAINASDGLICEYETTGNERSHALRMASGGDIQVLYSSDGTINEVDAAESSNLVTGQWYHVAVVFDPDAANDIVYYKNGVGNENDPTAITNINNSAAELQVGTYNDTTYMEGYLDEVILFTRALSSNEVNEIKDWGIDGSKGGND